MLVNRKTTFATKNIYIIKLWNILYIVKINICATPVSLAAFVVENVCDNVNLQHLHDCLCYRIQEEGNCSRGCIMMDDGYIFGGWGRGIDGGYLAGGRV